MIYPTCPQCGLPAVTDTLSTETHCVQIGGYACDTRLAARVATLRLACVGAACSAVIWSSIASDIGRGHEDWPALNFAAENAAEIALATLRALADLGDEVAVAMVRR